MQSIIWWILWMSMQTGAVMTYILIGNKPQGSPTASSLPEIMIFVLGGVPLIASMVFRWVWLPRAQVAAKALPLFLVGMAMAESVNVIGLIVFPAHKQATFIASMAGMIQFLPYYAGRFYKANKPS